MDLFINLILTTSSVALLCYWFRYSCLLILLAETPHDHSEEVAKANQLSFPGVRSGLRKHDVPDLDRLRKCLERDFAIVAYLLEHTPVTSFDTGFEDALLKIHFHTMSVCFLLTRRNFRQISSDALEEMSLVVVHLANQLGARSAAAQPI